jgi:hypothetical protein
LSRSLFSSRWAARCSQDARGCHIFQIARAGRHLGIEFQLQETRSMTNGGHHRFPSLEPGLGLGLKPVFVHLVPGNRVDLDDPSLLQPG